MQSANKMCVALLFGGMSSEHEVSCVSVGNFVRNIDRSKYEVLTVGITKEGRWLYTEATAEQMADGSWEELPGNMPCVISPDRADHGMILFTPDGRVEKMHLDVVIPVLHGLWGEDGIKILSTTNLLRKFAIQKKPLVKEIMVCWRKKLKNLMPQAVLLFW